MMTTFTGKTALIIEDDTSSILVLRKLLEQSGVSVEVIQDGHAIGPQILKVTKPDVIFLDLEMPQINGYEVINIIRHDAAIRDVPVVAYTTHTSHANKAKLAGFNGFLGKPLDSHLFPEQLARIFDGQSIWEIPG
jgi:CheY-like chemotaxis protein